MEKKLEKNVKYSIKENYSSQENLSRYPNTNSFSSPANFYNTKKEILEELDLYLNWVGALK